MHRYVRIKSDVASENLNVDTNNSDSDSSTDESADNINVKNIEADNINYNDDVDNVDEVDDVDDVNVCVNDHDHDDKVKDRDGKGIAKGHLANEGFGDWKHLEVQDLISFFKEFRVTGFSNAVDVAKQIAIKMDIDPLFIQKRIIHRKRQFDEDPVEQDVNQAAKDSDNALVCCVENTVEDRIMDSGTSFHATYCKEELERFKLCFGKDVRYIPCLKRRLISVGHLDEEGYRHQRLGDMNMIGMKMLASKGNVPDVRKKAMALHLLHQYEDPITMILLSKATAGVVNGIVMLKMVPETPLQFGVAERLSRTFKADSTGLRLRILEEEWRGKDTSLAHLKVFGCDSFVKVKDVYGEAMKCKFIGSGSDEMRYSFWDTKSYQVIQSRDITFMDSIYGARSATDSSSLTKPIQKSQVVLVDIPENLAENDSIVAEHRLSLEITQSLGGSSDTSEGSENSRSSKDSRILGEEESKDRASSRRKAPRFHSKESVQWKKAINEEMVSLEKNQTCSLVRLPSGKKASQSLWIFKVKEEHNSSKSEGFQLAGQKENLECKLKEILYGLIQAPRLRYLKFDSFMQKDKVQVFSWAKLVQILISERSLSLLKILGTKSLAKMFTSLAWIVQFGTIMQFDTSLSSLVQSLIISLWFDLVVCAGAIYCTKVDYLGRSIIVVGLMYDWVVYEFSSDNSRCFYRLPSVVFVLSDSYVDVDNQDYGGLPY
ncbi:retrovirus-related pol polyprotein from transposon TNT 1-94 [Tanacetum coccineum]